MTGPPNVIRFAERRAAYGFVAELRRLYDFESLAQLRVHELEGEILVELPPESTGVPLIDLARRHGGHPAAGPEELSWLRDAVYRARRSERAGSLEAARNSLRSTWARTDSRDVEIDRQQDMGQAQMARADVDVPETGEADDPEDSGTDQKEA